MSQNIDYLSEMGNPRWGLFMRDDRAAIRVGEDLTLRVGRDHVTRLTTSEALRLAEVLVRKSMRRMLDEEAGFADRISG